MICGWGCRGLFLGFDLGGGGAEEAFEVAVGEEVDAALGEGVVGAPDADAEVGVFGVDLDDDLRFAGAGVVGELLGEVGGQAVDARAADGDGGAALEVGVVEVPGVGADQGGDVDVEEVAVLAEPGADAGLEAVGERAVALLGAEVGADDDEDEVAGIGPGVGGAGLGGVVVHGRR